MQKAVIKTIHSYLPPKKITNEMIAKDHPDWDIEKSFANTGVAVRSIADSKECTSDLGVMAAQELFASGACAPEDIDFLIFCTQTPDYFLPPSACIMQEKLGLRVTCGAFDFKLGCSGYVYGLALAKGLIETNLAHHILFIVGDVLSKAINSRDRSALLIFSDGASATLISASDSPEESIGPFVFGTDGRGAKNLIIPAGGWRIRPTSDTAIAQGDVMGNFRSPQNLFMNGAEIFNFSLQRVPEMVKQILDKSGLRIEEIDYFVFHQANKFMLEALRRKLKIPKEKYCVNLESYGNTSSATIPMALEVALREGKINKDSKILVAGFGVGYSWAAAILKFL